MGNQRAKQTKKKTLGTDFKRVKRKVGRKIPLPENATKTSFKSKAIVLPEQSLGLHKSGAALSQRGLSLKELLAQSIHYSEKSRKDALVGLRELLSNHPREVTLHVGSILEAAAARMVDKDKAVRDALRLLLRSAVFPSLPQRAMAPFLPILMLHISSAMTHLASGVRKSALSFLDLMVENYPDLIQSAPVKEVLGHYVDLLSPQGDGVGDRSLSSLPSVLSSLLRYLTAVYGAPDDSERSQRAKQAMAPQVYMWGTSLPIMKSLGLLDRVATCGSHRQMPLHDYKNRPYPGNLSEILSIPGELTCAAGFGVTTPPSKGSAEKKRKRAEGKGADISTLPEKKEAPGHMAALAAVLVPRLLTVVAECSPALTPGASPDPVVLQVFQLVLQLLRLIFVHLLSSSHVAGPSLVTSAAAVPIQTSGNVSLLHLDQWGSGPNDAEGWAAEVDKNEELRGLMTLRQLFLEPVLRRLSGIFPLAEPGNGGRGGNAKLRHDMVAANIATCQLLALFLQPGGEDVAPDGTVQGHGPWAAGLLDYYEQALRGSMLPSSGLTKAIFSRQLAEPHWKALLPTLPGILAGAPPSHQLSLLEALTEVYQESRAHSSTKRTCLAVMSQLILDSVVLRWHNQGMPGGATPAVAIPENLLLCWLQSLPRLLWELKHSCPETSQMVLGMLREVGRRTSPGCHLGEVFANLQPHLIPFFCTVLPAAPTRPGTQPTAARHLFGPFVTLPEKVQVAALDCLGNFQEISPAMIRSLALCCLHPAVQTGAASRMLEFISHAFNRNAIGLDCHLSFLLTLLVGHPSGAAAPMPPGIATSQPQNVARDSDADDDDDASGSDEDEESKEEDAPISEEKDEPLPLATLRAALPPLAPPPRVVIDVAAPGGGPVTPSPSEAPPLTHPAKRLHALPGEGDSTPAQRMGLDRDVVQLQPDSFQEHSGPGAPRIPTTTHGAVLPAGDAGTSPTAAPGGGGDEFRTGKTESERPRDGATRAGSAGPDALPGDGHSTAETAGPAAETIRVVDQGHLGAVDAQDQPEDDNTGPALGFLGTRISGASDLGDQVAGNERARPLEPEGEQATAIQDAKRKRAFLAGATTAAIGQLGDGSVVLEVLGPAICRELACHEDVGEVYVLLRAVAVCCRNISQPNRGTGVDATWQAITAETLTPTIAAFLSTICQKTSGNGVAHTHGPRYRLACLAILRAAPDFLPAVIDQVADPPGPDSPMAERSKLCRVASRAPRARQVAGAMGAILCIYRCEALQGVLRRLEGSSRKAMQSLEDAVASVEGRLGSAPALRQQLGQLSSFAALLHGWPLEERVS